MFGREDKLSSGGSPRKRGMAPVFGIACGESFASYRVEFGVRRNPKRWELIKVSFEPQESDPYKSGRVRWDPMRGAKVNLAKCDTGLDGTGMTTDGSGIYEGSIP